MAKSITIQMDVNCKHCGRKGATEYGYCLRKRCLPPLLTALAGELAAPGPHQEISRLRIPLAFEKIVEGMLAVKPKKRPTRRKKKPGKK